MALLLVLSGVVQAAESALAHRVHSELAREHFAEAEALARQVLERVPAEPDGARLEALSLLLLSVSLNYTPARSDLAPYVAEIEQRSAGAAAAASALPRALVLEWKRDARSAEEFDHAATLLQQAMDAAGARLVRADRALVLRGLSIVALKHGRFQERADLLRQALAAVQVPRDDWERLIRVRILNPLADAEERAGQPDRALADLHAASTEALALVGPSGLTYNYIETTRAQILYLHGDYLGSRATIEPVIRELRKRADNPNDLTVALYLLSSNLRKLGDLAAAREPMDSALALAANDPNVSDRMRAVLYETSGEIELGLGHPDRARPHFQQSLSLLEQHLGPTDVHLAPSLNGLARTAQLEGDLDAAEGYYQRQLRATEVDNEGSRALLQHPVLEGLGINALRRGSPEEGEALLAKALDLHERSVGSDHPSGLAIRCELALARSRLGNRDDALATALASGALRNDLLLRVAPALGEVQMLRFKKSLSSCLGLSLPLAAEGTPDEIVRLWSEVIDARGIATRLQAVRIAAARQAAEPARRADWDRWAKAAESYANAVMQTGQDHDAAKTAHARSALDAAEAALGRQLLAKVHVFDPETQSLAQVRAALPAHTALVAFVAAAPYALPGTAAKREGGGGDLFAFVLDRDATSPRLVHLGPSSALDAIVERWHRLLGDPGADAGALADAGGEVRARLWDPLALAQPGRVLIVPDGAAALVSFAALPDGEGFLLERGWRVHTLDSERDATHRAKPFDGPGHLLLVGDLDFGTAPMSGGRATRCAPAFAPLPGTAHELEAIERLWLSSNAGGLTRLSGAEARKQRVRDLASSSTSLHFATHTFGADLPCDGAPPATRGVGISFGPEADEDPEAALAVSSGLVLSGANAAGAMGDAVMSAQEVVALPLDNVAWVVLAACDSGLGTLVSEEGVFGLRRAFRLAGVHSVVMSLWRVDDVATAQWMEQLYAARWGERLDTIDSVAEAQLRTLASRRARGLASHPFYWAAFVGNGDWD
ncbi:MAG TPA: CHAT domain-containing protein [Rhodanobacteraceae bacterium]|nr:CHAT domain-containing protein [Rhodanobacteraceae bacterium]